MYKGTWFFLVVFCAATLFGGPAHGLIEDHGGEVEIHCDGHGPLTHLEEIDGEHDLVPCDLCLTVSAKVGLEPSSIVTPVSEKEDRLLFSEEALLSLVLQTLPLLRAPPFVIL